MHIQINKHKMRNWEKKLFYDNYNESKDINTHTYMQIYCISLTFYIALVKFYLYIKVCGSFFGVVG